MAAQRGLSDGGPESWAVRWLADNVRRKATIGMSGDHQQPGAASTSAARTYVAAIDASNRGDWRRALSLLRELIAGNPGHPDIHHLLSVAALATGHHDDALEHAGQATRLQPDNPRYLLHAAQVVARVQSPQRALEVARQAELLVWNDGGMCMHLSFLYSRANAYADAGRVSARARELLPDDPRCLLNHATTLLFDGDLDAAEQAYRRAIDIEPAHARAHLGLAQLKRWSLASNHVERLRSHVAKAARGEDRMYFLLALSKELGDLGHDAEALSQLIAGKNEGKALARHVSRADDDKLFDLLESGAFEARQNIVGCVSEEPIFVMGMPRTGTTLVERILSSHSAVQSAGELLNFPIEVKRASGMHTGPLIAGETVRALRNADWRQLGAAYVASTRPLTGGSAHFVDKHPHNFLYMEMIARALPRARMICLRRHPLDTCLSNFRQLFSPASPFHGYSFDLLETGHYYARFRRLMDHFQRSLGDRVLWLDYESLVAQQEVETRRLLAFCGLSWEPGCLQFERNAAPVATASAPQVREKLHHEALGRWRRHVGELGPLVTQLTTEGIDIPGWSG